MKLQWILVAIWLSWKIVPCDASQIEADRLTVPVCLRYGMLIYLDAHCSAVLCVDPFANMSSGKHPTTAIYFKAKCGWFGHLKLQRGNVDTGSWRIQRKQSICRRKSLIHSKNLKAVMSCHHSTWFRVLKIAQMIIKYLSSSQINDID